MVIYIHSSIFDSPAQTLVNTVNTVGVMGKGLAKQFKSRFPEMYEEYRILCSNDKLSPGQLHLWRGDPRWVLNFPTKTTWRRPSKMAFVDSGLKKFMNSYRDLGITSISFPPLGCGNGELDWREVQPLMEKYLRRANIPVFIHNIQVAKDFIPEHAEVAAPAGFGEFLSDIRLAINKADGRFYTKSERPFSAQLSEDNSVLAKFPDGKNERLGAEMLEEAFSTLRHSLLYGYSFSDERARKLKSYLFPIITKLPYVRRVGVSHRGDRNSEASGFFIDPTSRVRSTSTEPKLGEQSWLFQ